MFASDNFIPHFLHTACWLLQHLALDMFLGVAGQLIILAFGLHVQAL